MSDLVFDSPTRNRNARGAGIHPVVLWLVQFSSTLLAILVGGTILLVGVRFYLHWSVKDTVQQVQEGQQQRLQERQQERH